MVMNTLLVTVQFNSVYSDNLIFNTDIKSSPSHFMSISKNFLERVLFLRISILKIS